MSETLCKRCNVATDYDLPVGRHWAKNGATKDCYDCLCNACMLAVWPSPVTFVFDWGLPAWVEPRMRSMPVLERLQKWFRTGPRCVVHFVNRKETESLAWQYRWNEWDHASVPRNPWSYRGYCIGERIVVIVDSLGVETPDSIEWITYHELAHLEQSQRANMSNEAWRLENKNEGRTGYDWESDAGHEADSEERHVNRVATAFMGGKEYARPWWRPRVLAAQAGEPIPPDPLAS